MVRGRLWRCANPHLPEAERTELVAALMAGRRAVRDAKRLLAERVAQPLVSGDAAGRDAMAEARRAVDLAKRRLGERGPVWWDDGSPDLNRHLALNTPYAQWYASLEPS